SEFQMSQISEGLTNVLSSVERLISSPSITNGLAEIGPTLNQYRLLGEKLNNRVGPMADSVTNTLAGADRALAQLRGAAENLRTLLSPDSPQRSDLDLALQQLAAAGQSITDLVEFLKRHPNALITGRELTPKKP